MFINCYAKNKGWLFEDILKCFQRKGLTSTHKPVDAERWLCIRTSEAYKSPDITKTVVQVHDDLVDYDIDFYNQSLGIIFTHPFQTYIWTQKKLAAPYITLPIGARSDVTISDHLPKKPTLGYFCGENHKGSKRSTMFAQIVAKVRNYIDIDVLMIGRQLEHIAHLGMYENRAAGVEDYSRIDCLITTSVSPGIPLSAYETLAAGKPVITTPRWFPGTDWPNVFTASSIDGLADHIIKVMRNRSDLFAARKNLSRRPYILEHWIDQCIAFVDQI